MMTRKLLSLLAIAVAGLTGTAEAVEFVSPAAGTLVKAGTSVTMIIRLSPGEQAINVGVLTSEGSTTATSGAGGLFEATVRIPQEAVGPDIIAAYAVLAGGGVSFARLEIVVDAGAIRALIVSARPVLTFAGEIAEVDVRGVFEDNVVRDLSYAERGTTYTSSDPGVLGSHPSGLIQARGSGTATLTVANGGRSETVSVEVKIPPGATNGIPVVTPPADQIVASETVVTLSAPASDPNGDPITYTWEQSDGRLIVLRNANTAQPLFIAPFVTSEHPMEFTVTVSDSHGATSFPVTVRVIVRPRAPDA